MTSNNEVLDLLNTIRGEMATKYDIAQLQWGIAALRAENHAQKNRTRSLRNDVANLRGEVESLRTRILDQLWEGIGETKEEVWRCGQCTRQEVWDEAREIKSKIADVEDGIEKLVIRDQERDEEAMEANQEFLRVIRRVDRVETRMKRLSWENEVPKRDSGVSFMEKEKQQQQQHKKSDFWYADGC